MRSGRGRLRLRLGPPLLEQLGGEVSSAGSEVAAEAMRNIHRLADHKLVVLVV